MAYENPESERVCAVADYNESLDERASHSQRLEDVRDVQEKVYDLLGDFAAARTRYYTDPAKVRVRDLLHKDVVMYAARGILTADEFVEEAFRAKESSSEETVMGNKWQQIIAAISDDTLDTGDLCTERDGDLYVCELKSQANTTNSSSFPQELRELKDKCEQMSRFKRASGQQVLPAFCVLRDKRSADEWRTYKANERDLANRDLEGFRYRYLKGKAFWLWLTGYDSIEGLVEDTSKIETGDVRHAREHCLNRLKSEMAKLLREHGLGDGINDVLKLKGLV